MRSNQVVFLVIIFLVNFLSLVYQIIWTRKLTVIFGSTALSISTVLTVFLSGIALGGYIGGLWIRKARRKSYTVGLLLIALGVYCAFSLDLLGLVKYPFYYLSSEVENPLAINLLKLVFSFLILIFPTTVIGSMFPVMTYLASTRLSSLGSVVASLYFLDTLGASAGAILSGFVLVPLVGLSVSTQSAAALYVASGLLMLFFGGAGDSVPEPAPAVEPGPQQRPMTRPLVLAALFLGGFSALLLEVTWSRYFHLIFGTSIYAFSLVVAAFLLGLSSGSIFIRGFLDRLKNPLLVFAYIEVLIACFALLTMVGSDRMEALYYRFYLQSGGFYSFQAVIFVMAFVAMLVPTFLMGANFPLAVRLVSTSMESRSRDVGAAFSINTAGGIFGAFVAGFAVIPLLGLEKTAYLASGIYLAIGFFFVLYSGARLIRHLTAVAAMAVFFFSASVKAGGPEFGYSVYYHGVAHETFANFLDEKKHTNSVFSKHGQYGLVEVLTDDQRSHYVLLNNGKADASTGEEDMPTQLLLGHLALFFHQSPDRVLNIGLGGGFTLGAIKAHPNVREIDAVEIDPLVVEATARFFPPYNNDALNDPRTTVHIQDGRHFLDTTGGKYDVIVSEPPNIWVSGVSHLFTKEFYRAADEHLKAGGMLVQWIPGYEMGREDLNLVLKTIKAKFPYVTYWQLSGDMLILASRQRPVFDPSYVSALMDVPEIARDVSRILSAKKVDTVEELFQNPVMEYEYLDIYLSDIKRINSDDLPYLEFNTARNIFKFSRMIRKK